MRFRILLFSSLLPLFLFAVGGGDNDGAGSGLGDCDLHVNGNGDYEIVCTGNGIFIQTITKTNELCNCSFTNCQDLKSTLLNLSSEVLGRVNNAIDSLTILRSDAVDLSSDIHGLYDSTNNPEAVFYKANQIVASIDDNLRLLQDDAYVSANTLYSKINQIECGECSSGSGGGGSCCDFSEIIDTLNSIKDTLEDFYDFIRDQFDFANDTSYEGLSYFCELYLDGRGTRNVQSLTFWPGKENFSDYFASLMWTTVDALPSLNNYFYKLTYRQVQPVYNTIHHKSFMYYKPSQFDNYYDYITNFYVRSASGSFTASDGNLRDYTNWFDRVEALLAALVFSSDSGTNVVNSADEENIRMRQEILNKLDGIQTTSSTQLSHINNLGQGIVSSLNQINQSFQRFSSLPGSVTLFTIDGNDGTSDSVSFQSSEMIYLIEACHCVTTLVWCFGGLWLMYAFLSWTIKKSYGLVLFCWSILSSVVRT